MEIGVLVVAHELRRVLVHVLAVRVGGAGPVRDLVKLVKCFFELQTYLSKTVRFGEGLVRHVLELLGHLARAPAVGIVLDVGQRKRRHLYFNLNLDLAVIEAKCAFVCTNRINDKLAV